MAKGWGKWRKNGGKMAKTLALAEDAYYTYAHVAAWRAWRECIFFYGRASSPTATLVYHVVSAIFHAQGTPAMPAPRSSTDPSRILNLRYALALCSMTAFIAGCSTIPPQTKTSTDADARALLDETQKAHGKAAFAAIRDVSVAYDGKWFSLVTRLQPILTDTGFRKTSEERMVFGTQWRGHVVAQQHRGGAGEKSVLRSGDKASVWYNGTAESDREKIAAAHLALEAYQLFLYPAFYVERAQHLERAGRASVNGRECDLLLAVLRPGFGASAEDRAVLYIDRQDKLVRRVRLTLEGLDSTKGAIVDVDHDRFVEIGGVQWPTHFYEALVRPFPGLPAHDFSLTGLDVNRGLTRADVAEGAFSERARVPARVIAK
jgi:hypothetical protein